jgi:hydrogenase maturation protein HypF
VPELIGATTSAAPWLLRTRSIWHAVVDDLKRGVSKARIAARFHAGIAEGFVLAAMKANAKGGIDQVVLSGGCLHNRRLARLLRAGLEAKGLKVYAHLVVSPGDGGLSYGQAAVGAALLSKRNVSPKT